MARRTTARRSDIRGADHSAKEKIAGALSGTVIAVALAAYLALFLATSLPGLPIRHESGEPYSRGQLAGYALAADILGLGWLEGASFGGFADRLYMLGFAVAYVGTATLAGWTMLRMMPACERLTRLEKCVFAAGLGLSLLSLFTLLLGLAGMLERRWFLLPAALGVIGVVSLRPRRTSEATVSSGDAASPVARWASWLLLPLAITTLLAAMTPPVDFDVREYHLQAPKVFFLQGQVTFLPHNVYANMPLGAEMHALAAMVLAQDWWWGALAGKTIIAAMTVLTSLALLAFGIRFFSWSAGVAAAVVYLATPWVTLVSTTGLIEGVVAFYGLLAVYAAALAIAADRQAGAQPAFIALAGCFSGSAVACKYPAALFVVVPVLAWLLLAGNHRGHLRRQIGRAALFVSMAAVTAGPWLLKNAMLTGNPVYPLLFNVFGGTTRTPEKHAQWVRAHDAETFSVSDFFASLGRAMVTSEWLSPVLLPLAACSLVLLLRAKQRGDSQDFTTALTRWLWGLLAFTFVAWWLLTHRIDRFLTPALPFVAVLAGAGAWTVRDRVGRVAVSTALVVATLFGVALTLAGLFGDNRFFMSFQQLRADPQLVSRQHRFLNDQVAGNSAVLLVGDAQPFDLAMPAFYNTCFDDNVLEQLVKNRSGDEIRDAFRARNISHVLVDWNEIERYRSPGNYGFTPFVQPDVFARLQAEGLLKLLLEASDESRQVFLVTDLGPSSH